MKLNSKILLIFILLLSFVLRFYKLDTNPPGLYVDEVAIGYNASQILRTGHDEHGERMPIFFKSFGDYKMPIYIYSVSGAMAVFGKSDLAVRFPSALAGVLSVYLIYLISKKIFSLEEKLSKDVIEKISLLATLLLSISPWGIQFSRGGFEANMALSLFLLAIYPALLFFENKKIKYIFFSAVIFSLTVYTYHTYRIISPLAVMFLSTIFLLENRKEKMKILMPIIVFGVLVIPIFIFSFSDSGSARFAATSVFSELPELSLIQKLFEYPFALFKNYLSFFSFYFLFATGDGIGRHQIPEFGPLFRWQLPFFILGLFGILKFRNKYLKMILFFLLLVAPLPASFAVPSPQTLRSLLMVIPMILIISVGIIFFIDRLGRSKQLGIIAIVILSVFEFIFYSHYYYVHYPKVNQLDWGAGYKEIVENTDRLRGEYDYVIADEYLSFIPIYFKFYSPSSKPQMVKNTWIKPEKWKGKKVLYIRPYYGPSNSKDIIYNVYLNQKYSDKIFAQFWSL